ncbi:MAG: hypothetical protein CMH57_09730 [Myxococcales bacterium]|nr:hypothetical protein [Myxococcales bacterium]
MDKKKLRGILLAIFIPLGIILLTAAIFGFWYYYIRETPKVIVKKAIKAARRADTPLFQSYFAPLSLRALDTSWSGETYGRAGSWERMMRGLLEPTGGPPEVLGETLSKDETQAKVQVRLDGVKRNIYLQKVTRTDRYLDPFPICSDWQPDFLCSDWRIDILQGINEGVNEEIRKAKAKEAKPEEFAKEPREQGWWRPEEDGENEPTPVEEDPDADKARDEEK